MAGDEAHGEAEDQRALAAGFSDGGDGRIYRGFAGGGDGEVGEGDAGGGHNSSQSLKSRLIAILQFQAKENFGLSPTCSETQAIVLG